MDRREEVVATHLATLEIVEDLQKVCFEAKHVFSLLTVCTDGSGSGSQVRSSQRSGC